MAAQRSDDSDHDEWNDFEGFGEFGVSSAEFPAVFPNGPVWREAWAAQQKARTLSLQTIEACYQQRMISGPAVDLLQDEFSHDLVPEMRYHPQRRVWLIWSARHTRWFSLDTWERMAQEALPIDHPERLTAVLRYPTNHPQLAGFRQRQRERLTPPLEHPAVRTQSRRTGR